VSRRWSEDSIRRELDAFLPAFDVFPQYSVVRASGRRGLWQAMPRRGGPEHFAEDYGLPYARNDRPIRERLRAALRASDVACWPSRQWLLERGVSELVAAIHRSGGPRRWAQELGLPSRHLRGQRWTPDTIGAAVEPLLPGRSAWPSRLQFERAGSAACGSRSTTARGMRRWPPATGRRSSGPTWCRHGQGGSDGPRHVQRLGAEEGCSAATRAGPDLRAGAFAAGLRRSKG
jgi:hypothetical protein